MPADNLVGLADGGYILVANEVARTSGRRYDGTDSMRAFIDRSGLLIIGTVLALAWANLAPHTYESFAAGLHFFVNDIAMAFFFALAAKEVVEATAPDGALHPPRRAALPLVAAVGGMAGPAVLYLALAAILRMPELRAGWAIPCATDIAFSYLAARLIFGAGHPAVPFLLLLAIADDALGLAIIAVFYPTGEVRLIQFGMILSLALGVAWWLRRRRTMNFWPYILGAGAISWFAFYRGGLHPALALVPIVPFLPHAARDAGLLVESNIDHDPLSEFEHRWKMPVQIILCLFGFANAGVSLLHTGAGTWMVLTAILVGKPLGILAAILLGLGAGLTKPAKLAWTDLPVLGATAGIGFTVSLFFATASFPPGVLLDQVKMGALLSLGSGIVAAVIAWALGVGRFAHRRNDSSALSA
jgi:NhaA family Na+:H+ antiporter